MTVSSRQTTPVCPTVNSVQIVCVCSPVRNCDAPALGSSPPPSSSSNVKSASTPSKLATKSTSTKAQSPEGKHVDRPFSQVQSTSMKRSEMSWLNTSMSKPMLGSKFCKLSKLLASVHVHVGSYAGARSAVILPEAATVPSARQTWVPVCSARC